MKRIFITLLAMTALACAIAQDQNAQNDQMTLDMSDMTISEILDRSEQLSILNALVDATDLNETLSGEGPYTLFAPTDRAWVLMRGDLIADLLNDPDALTQVLRYHVLSEELRASDLVDQLVADAERRAGEGAGADAPEPAGEGDEAALDEQQLGDAETANMEVEDPFRALLETGTTSAMTFDTLHGAQLEVSSVYTDPAAGTSPDVAAEGEDAQAEDAQGMAGAGDAADDGQRIGEQGVLMGIWEPVQALRLTGVDLSVQDARLVSVDIVASNGVIHLIEGVLVPEDVDLGR